MSWQTFECKCAHVLHHTIYDSNACTARPTCCFSSGQRTRWKVKVKWTESSLREMRGLGLDQNLHSIATRVQVLTCPVLVSLWLTDQPSTSRHAPAGRNHPAHVKHGAGLALKQRMQHLLASATQTRSACIHIESQSHMLSKVSQRQVEYRSYAQTCQGLTRVGFGVLNSMLGSTLPLMSEHAGQDLSIPMNMSKAHQDSWSSGC